MKQRNIMRFVGLRGPVVHGASNVPRATPGGPAPAPDQFDLVAEIRRLIALGEPVDAARERVAREFMNSAAYVFRDPQWRPFLGLQGDIETLIAELRRSGAAADFGPQLEARIRARLGADFELAAFLEGEDYAVMRAGLWNSYFANLVLDSVRPADRPALVFWIRLFTVLDRLRQGGDVAELIARFADIKPITPLLVTGRRPPRSPPAADPDTDDASDAEALQSRARIDSLRRIRAVLQRSLKARLAAKRQSQTEAASDTDEALPARGPSRASPDRPVDPWLVAPGDLDDADLALLEQEGVVVEGQPAPAVLAEIDARAAHGFGRLFAATRRSELVLVRGVLIRRRTVRRPKPPPPREDGYAAGAP